VQQRSELVALDVADIEHVRRGIVLHLRRSKTDQDGRGQKIAIPYGRTRWCPVAALEAWLAASEITAGAIFRPVDRHSHVHNVRLSGEAVSLVVRERASAAGLDATGYSGHSLRAGLATSAAQAGVPASRIKAQTRHASDAMLSRYIREGELFTENAAGALL
jgi:integrase